MIPVPKINPKIAAKLVWSRPDDRSPAICSLCQGPLPEVPLMMWKDDGSAVSLCDQCMPKLFYPDAARH